MSPDQGPSDRLTPIYSRSRPPSTLSVTGAKRTRAALSSGGSVLGSCHSSRVMHNHHRHSPRNRNSLQKPRSDVECYVPTAHQISCLASQIDLALSSQHARNEQSEGLKEASDGQICAQFNAHTLSISCPNRSFNCLQSAEGRVGESAIGADS